MPTSSAIVEAQQDSRSKSTILWNVPNRFGIRRKRSYTAHLRSFENCKALWKLSHFRPRQTHNGQEVVFLHLISKAITKLIMTKRHWRNKHLWHLVLSSFSYSHTCDVKKKKKRLERVNSALKFWQENFILLLCTWQDLYKRPKFDQYLFYLATTSTVL